MDYFAPTNALSNYCPYHQTTDHVIEDCANVKDDVKAMIRRGVIDLGDSLANPPQPHIRQPPNGPTDSMFHSANVINASSPFGLPESEAEQQVPNPYLSSRWYTNWHPLHQCSFVEENTKLLFDNLTRQKLIKTKL
ncbi:hypothetical protein Taro_033197 [Colocasia esculenta]|uniref:Uncharacterized protein n=1 Tax=Colocasia esculenta TaxID=4460 RepID=A0A843VN81_COLES|nr:hypothetical protein [Colocasia esculenta]